MRWRSVLSPLLRERRVCAYAPTLQDTHAMPSHKTKQIEIEHVRRFSKTEFAQFSLSAENHNGPGLGHGAIFLLANVLFSTDLGDTSTVGFLFVIYPVCWSEPRSLSWNQRVIKDVT